MSKILAPLAIVIATAVLPVTAAAAGIVFDSQGTGRIAGWKAVGTATSTGNQGYWDRRSYDSATNTNAGACAAGTLVGGVACDWNSPGGVRDITSPSQATPGPGLEYFGLLGGAGADDAPLNFYFTGPLAFDATVLFQLTAWDDQIEFGWYEAGNPENRTAIFGGGPFTANDGQPGTTAPASMPTGDFGFYYRNSRFASGDFLFFTESRFNRMGGYFAYFAEWGVEMLPARFEDELVFGQSLLDDPQQQFALFRQGNNYWLGIEDQIGRPTGQFCSELAEQPCSDYDFNDFLIGWTESEDVPEPASISLIAGALLGFAWSRRRRS